MKSPFCSWLKVPHNALWKVVYNQWSLIPLCHLHYNVLAFWMWEEPANNCQLTPFPLPLVQSTVLFFCSVSQAATPSSQSNLLQREFGALNNQKLYSNSTSTSWEVQSTLGWRSDHISTDIGLVNRDQQGGRWKCTVVGHFKFTDIYRSVDTHTK